VGVLFFFLRFLFLVGIGRRHFYEGSIMCSEAMWLTFFAFERVNVKMFSHLNMADADQSGTPG